jgi:hypothetical protein
MLTSEAISGGTAKRADVGSADRDRAGSRVEKSRDQLKQGALSAAGSANEEHFFASAKLETREREAEWRVWRVSEDEPMDHQCLGLSVGGVGHQAEL